MSFRLALGLSGLVGSLLFTSVSQAQCSKDTDCKGDRICDGGACVAPSNPLPAAPGPAVADATAPGPAVADAAAAPPSPSAVPPVAAAAPLDSPPPPSTFVQDMRPQMQRHSTGMMAGGIVMVSFVPIALLAAMVANLEQTACEGGHYSSIDGGYSSQGINCGRFDATIYGGLLGSAVLLGVGIPLIVIGGKKEPVGTARLAPWATPQGAGLQLRVDL